MFIYICLSVFILIMKIIELLLVCWRKLHRKCITTSQTLYGAPFSSVSVACVRYSSTMSAPPSDLTQEIHFLTLLSQWTSCCGRKPFGKEHKDFMWDNSLTSGPVCLITLQNWATQWKMSCLKCLKYTMCLVNFIFFVRIHFQTVTSWYI